MILGGRYEEQQYHGSAMGMEFDGLSLTGFDNATREYVGVWIDSMGTGMTVSRGPADAQGVIRMTGEMVDPRARKFAVREVFSEKGRDAFLMEMFIKGPDFPDEFKMMEMTYTRKR
jgi:hypothetical protein